MTKDNTEWKKKIIYKAWMMANNKNGVLHDRKDKGTRDKRQETKDGGKKETRFWVKAIENRANGTNEIKNEWNQLHKCRI